jgi:hypothetical protein
MHAPAATISRPCARRSPRGPAAVCALAAVAAAQQPAAPPGDHAQAPSAAVQAAATPQLHSINVSLDILAAFGSSTASNADIRTLQGGGHDPSQRGFTLQEAELGLSGAIDQSFAGEAMVGATLLPDGTTEVELEEAFLVTTALPHDLQVKAGHYLTEFGRINPMHPHGWVWIDQPIVISRIFGGDGTRAPGARLAWELPGDTPGQIIIGVQNAGGEALQSFLANDEVYAERPVGGRFFVEREIRSWNDFLYSARIEKDLKLGDATGISLGASLAYGPNATGPGADTIVYGADFVLRWKGSDDHSFTLQGEVVARDFEAADQIDQNDPTVTGDEVAVPGATLHDWGFYLQGHWRCGGGWGFGLRGEWASGSGASYDQTTDTFARSGDPFRADRLRITPLITYETSAMSRLRLQYDYDDTDQLDDPEHSVWLGFVVMIGQHPKHVYRPQH